MDSASRSRGWVLWLRGPRFHLQTHVSNGSGAHQQARAENAMSRYKRIIGDRLRAKRLEAQKREAAIAVNAINRMTELGMPESVQVSA